MNQVKVRNVLPVDFRQEPTIGAVQRPASPPAAAPPRPAAAAPASL